MSAPELIPECVLCGSNVNLDAVFHDDEGLVYACDLHLARTRVRLMAARTRAQRAEIATLREIGRRYRELKAAPPPLLADTIRAARLGVSRG